jgi:hypothetical protein
MHRTKFRTGQSKLESERGIQQRLFNLLAELPWDWLMRLPIPEYFSPYDDPKWNLRNWLREIEQADATRFFRWVLFIPRPYKAAAEERFVLIGGLSSGEWWYWSRRWSAMNDHPGLIGRLEWWAGRKQSLGPVFEKLFGHSFVDVDMRFGSTASWPERTLQVDADGMPLDPAMRKALKTVNKPKPKRPVRTKWQNVLTWQERNEP